jgi:8-oxo-dGTP pyrophosphatase MutT (NUDIX family)
MIKAESAGGIVVNQFNEVVIVFTDTLSWQFPKGTVEKGDDYIATAIREIEEETGLQSLKLIKKFPMYTRISTDKKVSRDIHYFLFQVEKLELRPGAEVTVCEWIPLSRVENMLTYEKDREFFNKIKSQIKYHKKEIKIKKK